MKQKSSRRNFIILILILAISLAGCGGKDNSSDSKSASKDPVQIDISFVGDIMAHQPQIDGAKSEGGYSFEDCFQYITEYLNDSDLAVCNLETTFAGEPYMGYPSFSAPEELAKDIKNSGFDMAVTANNHILDKGGDGLKRTVEVLDEAGLPQTGIKSSPEDKGYLIKDIDGVKVGIVAATYETSMIDGNRTLNGTTISDEEKSLINSFNYELIDEDLAEYKQCIDDAKAEGAEVIISYLHWGEEYQKEPNDTQKSVAKKVAELGADIIFASHPHVVQEKDSIVLETEGATKEVPVFYSMGNFISNQRLETVSNRYTEEGIIAQARITYDPNEGTISSIETGYIPTWVDKYSNGDKMKYVVIPLTGDYESNSTLENSGHLSNAKQAKSDLEEIMGEANNIFAGN